LGTGTTKNFFKKQSEASAVKTRITSNYFDAWSKIALKWANGGPIAYIDMYCGPGRYDSGDKSTPLTILETAVKNPELKARLVTIFNDESKKYVGKLETEIRRIPGIDDLVHKPVLMNTSIGLDTERYFLENSTVPALTFIDPFGYTGLTRNLIKGVTKSFLCDCIFFFSYSSINRALSANGIFSDSMESIFGRDHARALEEKLNHVYSPRGNQAALRETLILDALTKALEEVHQGYVRWFRFKKGTRTSHMLVSVSKHPLGYRIMNEIMAAEGFIDEKGIPFYTYYGRPMSRRKLYYIEFDNLKEELPKKYAGQTRTRRQIYEEHSVRRNYVSANYKDVLLELETEGRVKMSKPASQRQREGQTTLGDTVQIAFPRE
jgi:three-Cys-motif partner protein